MLKINKAIKSAATFAKENPYVIAQAVVTTTIITLSVIAYNHSKAEKALDLLDQTLA